MKSYKMIPANKDNSVMIKEKDRYFWHVRQWRRDIDPGDNRKFRDTPIIQLYDTPNFNRIFRPEIFYGPRFTKTLDAGKESWMDHRKACLIFDYQVVHDPTLVGQTYGDNKESKQFEVIAGDDLGGHQSSGVNGDDLGTAKKPGRKPTKK